MNRLTALICFPVLLALPASASARLTDLGYEPTRDRGAAGCAQATGGGSFAALGPYSRTDSATDLRTVSRSGIALSARVRLGRLIRCAAVAEAPGGAAIVAGTVLRDGRPTARRPLRAALREPGGEFGPPFTLGRDVESPAVAIAPSGAAVAAWVRDRRLVVARRAPGGAFGPPERVLSWHAIRSTVRDVSARIDAGGTATVLLAREDDSGTRVEVAGAAAGAPFAIQRLARAATIDASPSLAVAPDGWALVTFAGRGDDSPPRVFERAPGAARFTAVALPDPPPPDRTHGWSTGGPEAAIRDGGGAIVAWRTGPFELRGGVDAMTREAPGPFAPRRVAAPGPADLSGESESDFFLVDLLDPRSVPPVDHAGRADLSVALALGGRVLLAWPAPAGAWPLTVATARAATGRLDGTFEPAATLGGPAREATDIAALFGSDGTAAVAWTDNAEDLTHGRLHVAAEGLPGPRHEPGPGLTLRADRVQRLFESQPVRVTGTCDGPCDLRATVISRGGPGEAHAITRLRGGAFALDAGVGEGIRPGSSRVVRVVVHAIAPDGGVTKRSLRVRVERRRPLPLRRPLDVRARRRGESIVVTWRTAAPARRQTYILLGYRGRNKPGIVPGTYAIERALGRRRFRVRLRPSDADRVRVVIVFVESYESGADGPLKTVRVR